MSVVIKGNSNVNLDFSTGGRITGDFSNATLANRVMFQSTTAGGGTSVAAIPNATGDNSAFNVFANPDPTNTSFGQFRVGAGTGDVRLTSGISGTGTYLPMTFYTGGSERVRIDTAGNLGLGVTPSAWAAPFGSGVFEFSGGAISGSTSANVVRFNLNSFYNGSNYIYKTSAHAAAYVQSSGSHQFFTAPSGTAGNAISFSQVMTLDASGNLGVGTSSPWSQISSYGTSGATTQYIGFKNVDGGDIRFGKASGVDNGCILGTWSGNGILLHTNSTERARIDSSGNLLVGTTSAPANWNTVSPKMRVAAGGIQVGDYCLVCEDAFDTDSLCLVSDSTENICFGNYNRSTLVYTERARITSAGYLLVGTTSNAFNFRVNVVAQSVSNPAAIGAQVGADGAYALGVQNASGTNVGGVIANTSSTSYATSSDYRLKENIQPMTGALAKVTALKPVTYKWKATGGEADGFIAHELAEVCPSAVTGEKDAVNEDGSIKPQGIDTSFLVATLTAAIQEQQAIIESLTARITALEAK